MFVRAIDIFKIKITHTYALTSLYRQNVYITENKESFQE